MVDSNNPSNPEFIDETYVPNDIKSRVHREDWSNLVRSYILDLFEQETYSNYLLPDHQCGFWPKKDVAANLGAGHKPFADIWPADRSAHLVGLQREHITHHNALTDIPTEKKNATFETGLDMLVSEIFATYECEHRRLGTRESSILEMDSDVYYELKHHGEKETNDIQDLVARLIDQMLVYKKEARESSINWEVVMRCAEHIGVPTNVIESSRKRLEEWYALSDYSLEQQEKQKTKEKKRTQRERRRRQAATKDASLNGTGKDDMQTRAATKRKSSMDANGETSNSKQPRISEESTSE